MYNKYFRRFCEGAPADGGAGGSGAAPAGGAATLVAPAGGAAALVASTGGEWYDTFQDANVKEWVKAYGSAYRTPESMALKAMNLEKFVGAEKAGRGVVAPKADAKPEEWQEFYKKVGGVPEKADGYKIPEAFQADPMMNKFREFMHSKGVPPIFFDSAIEFYTKDIAGGALERIKNSDAELDRKTAKDMSDLQIEWQGKDDQGAPIYDKNIEMGRRAAREFIPHTNDQELEAALTSIEGAMGTKAMLKMLANIGGSLGEHAFVRGDGGGDGKISTPEGAKLRIAELKNDKEWSKSFTQGDADKRKEWDNLHKLAYPEKK